MVGKIELQACPRDYHQSAEGFKKLDKILDRKYSELEPLYVEAGFSGMEDFGGNQTVAYAKQGKNPFNVGKASFDKLGKPDADEFTVHGLVRESSLNGYAPCDDDIAKIYFKKVAEVGNSVRIFSGANDFEALKRQIDLAKENNLHVQVDIAIQSLEPNIDNLKEYVLKAVDHGADQINFKSHSGSANLEVLAELTKWMDETLPEKIKLGYHTHCTYGNAYDEVKTFVDSIQSDRTAVVHTGPGLNMSDGFAQPDPNKIIEMYPDKVQYNREGLDKLNAATTELNTLLESAGLGNKTLEDKLKAIYEHKYSGEELDAQVTKIAKLFEAADVPGGGALYTINDLEAAGCIGKNAKGKFAQRDYLEDYLNVEKEFKKYDGAADDVTPFYFLREQNTKFFLNTVYNSGSFDPAVNPVDLFDPETMKLNGKDKHLQKIVLGEYGQMPFPVDDTLQRRALEERINEVAAKHGIELSSEDVESYVKLGQKFNEMYQNNKTKELLTEDAEKLRANYGNSENPDEQKYYMDRMANIQARINSHEDKFRDVVVNDASYKDFMRKGEIDSYTKQKLKEHLPGEIHVLIDPPKPGEDTDKTVADEMNKHRAVVKDIRKAATVQLCTPSLLLEGQVEKAKQRINNAIDDFVGKCEKDGKPLPDNLKKVINNYKHSESKILIAQFLRPTENAANIIGPMAANDFPMAWAKYKSGTEMDEPLKKKNEGNNTAEILDARRGGSTPDSQIEMKEIVNVTNFEKGL